jgi:hypothetical protein
VHQQLVPPEPGQGLVLGLNAGKLDAHDASIMARGPGIG